MDTRFRQCAESLKIKEPLVYDAVVIGSGAAGYGCADWLYRFGVKNIAVVTENKNSGTSRNTGSDKQTYYKLSLDGKTPDCAYDMASDIASGGCCDGELAYCEAQNSIRSFMRLVEYGVPFPKDSYGAFPGYKTDHDTNGSRATSVGPLTSKIMTEKLEDRVIKHNKTVILDNLQVVKIVTESKKCLGLIAYNEDENALVPIVSNNVVAATGAPSCIYSESVYPESQHGMTGVLLEAGVKLCNFAEWQYGIASLDFRWNLSGSYMQVVPSFISVGEDGDEKEILNDNFDLIFEKGCQWPFSAKNIDGTSEIDLIVRKEQNKGRTVYLDYRKNPDGFSIDELSSEARSFLQDRNARLDTPIERLKALNPKAYELYLSHNIDLQNERLKIGVCAQHNNGGAYVDTNYETNINGLFAVGEVAGVFGLTRPGGTALNSTQVGGLRVAQKIASEISQNSDKGYVISETEKLAENLKNKKIGEFNCADIPKEMSKYAGVIRDVEKCKDILRRIDNLLINTVVTSSLTEFFRNTDMLISAKALLNTIINASPLTGSRGGSLTLQNGKILPENEAYRKKLTISDCEAVTFKEITPIPQKSEPFESYLSKIDL